MEVLQFLKQLYKQERLNFTSHLIPQPEDYSISEASDHAIKELLNAGKSKELLELLRNMVEGRAEAGATYS